MHDGDMGTFVGMIVGTIYLCCSARWLFEMYECYSGSVFTMSYNNQL